MLLPVLHPENDARPFRTELAASGASIVHRVVLSHVIGVSMR